MNNCIEYLKWRGDLSFSVSPLNEVDLCCLAMLAVLHFDGIIPENEAQIPVYDAIDAYFASRPKEEAGSELGVFESQECVPLAKLLRTCSRYKGITVSGYNKKIREERTEQFGALSFDLPGDLRVILFLSTDDTIIGWKEDFMLAVSSHLPAQKDALKYLKKFGIPSKKLILAGHSKGGNLSIYSGIFADASIQDRILRIVSFDGPGFDADILETAGYARIKKKIMTLRSQDSIIGTLLNEAGRIVTVRSAVSGLMAHDLFNWEIGRTNFIRVSGMSPMSRRFDKAIDAAMMRMSMKDRIAFIDGLFDLISQEGANTTLSDLKKAKLKKHLETAGKLKDKPEVVSFFLETAAQYLAPESMKLIRSRRRKKPARGALETDEDVIS